MLTAVLRSRSYKLTTLDRVDVAHYGQLYTPLNILQSHQISSGIFSRLHLAVYYPGIFALTVDMVDFCHVASIGDGRVKDVVNIDYRSADFRVLMRPLTW
jgi:hypothetical protein